MANPNTGNEVDNFPNAPPKYFDNGSGAKLLQPTNQVTFVADQAAYSAAAFNALRDALIVAGIMKAS